VRFKALALAGRGGDIKFILPIKPPKSIVSANVMNKNGAKSGVFVSLKKCGQNLEASR
jgi:hypothetical protein